MAKIKITLVKSSIGSTKHQKNILEALGLHKLHASKKVEATPQIVGMVNKMKHLVKVEEL